jgi:hypothetical protein
MLDPACGSMHFGLYAFDLFEQIYEEAWDLARQESYPVGADVSSFEGFQEFVKGFATREAFMKEVPRLIMAHNIHGIDIDPRAVQIAGLTLWLRAQRSWARQGLKPAQRPKILKSNVVCAEPIPAEESLVQEFVKGMPPALGGLLLDVLDLLKLAGEAGALLKVETAIPELIQKAKKAWGGTKGAQPTLFGPQPPEGKQLRLDSPTIRPDAEFWDDAENQLLQALSAFAEQAVETAGFRRLFAHDVAQGFGFLDVCRKKFDTVLMNPPFGACSTKAKKAFDKSWPLSKCDVLAAFVEVGINLLHPRSRLGAITSRTGFFLSSFQKWREEVILKNAPPAVFADLGHGVMDAAMVEAAAYCLERVPATAVLKTGRDHRDIESPTNQMRLGKAGEAKT